MSSTEWYPEDAEKEVERTLRFGDALAELAVERDSEMDAVKAVRESREGT